VAEAPPDGTGAVAFAAGHQMVPLTMPQYRDRLRDSGIRNAAQIAGSLAADGLIRRVPPSGEDAVEFARQHRVMPLMTGIGITDESRPGRYAIGVFGRPMTYVDEIGYWLWFDGHRWNNLWLASAALAETQPGEGTGEPAACLTLILTRLHRLLSRVRRVPRRVLGSAVDAPSSSTDRACRARKSGSAVLTRGSARGRPALDIPARPARAATGRQAGP